jgi:hypothetical protein
MLVVGLSLAIMFGCKKDSSKVTYTNTIVPLTILGFTNAPTAVLNQSFVRQLPAMGGKPPYTWTITEGTLPPGLSLSPNGRIYGIATSTGQYSYKLTLTDSKGSSSTSSYTQTISASGTTPFLLGTPQIPDYGQNQDVGYVFFAQGGSLPWTFIITGLPVGLTYDPASGLISGSPPDAFSGSITITLQDAAQTMASGSPVTASFAVNAPQPTGGGGNGGGGFSGCPSSYDGTYMGQFTYVYYQKGQDGTYSPVNAGFQLTIKLSCLASAGGSTVLNITHANCSEPAFNCQVSGCTPGTLSFATLPADPPTNSSNPSMSGQGILITFPNGSTIGTANSAGDLNVSSDGRTLANSLSPDIQNSTWVAQADGFHSGSVPTGGPVTEFKSWSMTWSNTLKESYQTLLSTTSLMNCKDCCYP